MYVIEDTTDGPTGLFQSIQISRWKIVDENLNRDI